jgi:hypothetical protein
VTSLDIVGSTSVEERNGATEGEVSMDSKYLHEDFAPECGRPRIDVLKAAN